MMPLGHVGIPLVGLFFRKDISFDLRFLFIGCILPDLIDKPLGHIILPENNGRIIAHSLVFAIFILGAALMYRPLLPLSLGVSIHQLLDGMFLEPYSAAWPLFGGFPHTEYELVNWLIAFTKPFTIAEELIGLVLIVLFIWKFNLLDRGNLSRLFRTGKA